MKRVIYVSPKRFKAIEKVLDTKAQYTFAPSYRRLVVSLPYSENHIELDWSPELDDHEMQVSPLLPSVFQVHDIESCQISFSPPGCAKTIGNGLGDLEFLNEFKI